MTDDLSHGSARTTAIPPIEIAVVIVTRNMADGLKTTIESVFSICDSRVRVYVVDGASGDGSVDYLQQNPSIQWVSEPDAGIYDAMNKGWKMPPSNAYILYLGSGDKILSLPTSETLLRLHSQGTDIVIGTCFIGRRPFKSGWHGGIYHGNTAHHQALLVRKSLNPQPPFDASMKVYADWDFNVRLFKRGLQAYFDESFQSYAEPGGVSAVHNLSEVWLVSTRHGGLRTGLRAYRMNLKEMLKLRLKKAGFRSNDAY